MAKRKSKWDGFGSGYKFRLKDAKSRCKSEETPHVVAFSGGRTSGFMLRVLLDSGVSPIVLFANTGKERDETLDFVHDIETHWGVDVVWLEYDRVPCSYDIIQSLKTKRMKDYFRDQETVHWFRRVTYETASRHLDDNGPFDKLVNWMSVLPNPRVRACTAQLKIRTMQRYLWSIGIYSFSNYIGFRSDEPDRGYDLIYSADRDLDVRLDFPLMRMGITEQDVLRYWKEQQFDLRLQSYEGNCHLCFLKKRAAKQILIREQPELAMWWLEQENKKSATAATGGFWRAEKGHSIKELMEDSQEEMGDDPVMECACTGAMSLSLNDKVVD